MNGIEYNVVQMKSEKGPLSVHMVSLDLERSGPSYEIVPALARIRPQNEKLYQVANSMRRIASATSTGIRGTMTKDSVLVIARGEPGSEPFLGYECGEGWRFLGESGVFRLIQQITEQRKLLYRSTDATQDFAVAEPTTVEEECVKMLLDEGRAVYSTLEEGGEQSKEFRIVAPTLPIAFCDGYDTLPEICERSNAIAGVNGGFFANFQEEMSLHTVFNDPVGILMINERILIPPSFRRAALIVNEHGKPSFEVLGMEDVWFRLGGTVFSCRTKPVDGCLAFEVNPEEETEFSVFTRFFSRNSPRGGADIVISRSYISEVRREGGAEIPQNGFVLKTKDADLALRILAEAHEARDYGVQYGLHVKRKERIIHAIAGGPILVSNRRRIDEQYLRGEIEQFKSREVVPTRLPDLIDSTKASAPRTGLGLTDEGKFLMVTIDDDRKKDTPPDKRYSVGTEILGFAKIMADLGCYNAMNLDGGGSATIWFNGLVRNRPSDGFVRSIPDAIIVRRRYH